MASTGAAATAAPPGNRVRIRRRELLWLLGAMSLPLRARAQKKYRVGILAVGVASAEQQQMGKLILTGLMSRAGFDEGRNIDYEWRFAEGDASRMPALAQEMVALKPDLIIASFNPSIAAAQKATRTIPVVMLNAIAPVELGFVESLGRPGANISGTAWSTPDMMGKIFEALHEAAPKAKRVACLGNPGYSGERYYRKAAVAAAEKLGLALEYFDAARPQDIAPALKQIAAAKPQALYVAFDTALLSGIREIGDFALKRRLPALSTVPQFVDVGGLLYYGPNVEELAERTVSFVTRILNGARPGDLPVELPSRYQLVASQRTAKAIGIVLPRALLLRADRVVE
jgi:putative tryptophan/tyrosine transport system substrate-binding protein